MMEQKQKDLLMKRWEPWVVIALCVVAAIIISPFLRPVTDRFFFWLFFSQADRMEEATSLLSENRILSELSSSTLSFLALLPALWCSALAIRVIADCIQWLMQRK